MKIVAISSLVGGCASNFRIEKKVKGGRKNVSGHAVNAANGI